MNCWKCGGALDLPSKKISFRALCDHCHAWLHCCKNCVNYKPGLPNDCKIPGTDYIADREAGNFCEEFVLLGKPPSATARPDDVSQRLFGEGTGEVTKNPKDRFNDLF